MPRAIVSVSSAMCHLVFPEHQKVALWHTINICFIYLKNETVPLCHCARQKDIDLNPPESHHILRMMAAWASKLPETSRRFSHAVFVGDLRPEQPKGHQKIRQLAIF